MRQFQHSEAVAARRDLFAQMVLDTDYLTAATGLSLTVEIVKAGGSSYAAFAGGSSEIGDGTYKISLAAADLDTVGEAMLQITATGAAPQFIPIKVSKFIDEIHQVKAVQCNAGVHTISTGVDEFMDDDGITLLLTSQAAEEIAVTAANWTNSTKLLTQTGAFTQYVHSSGDVISLTAGTGVVAGEYTIVAKIDDDTIELAADINGDGGDISDDSVVGTIDNGRIMVTTS